MKFERYGLGIAKGLMVTFKHLFRHPITTQYPEQRLVMSRRIRGNELIWNKDKCTGCSTCAKTCPQGVIQVRTSVGPDNSYQVDQFEVDTGYCIFCGLCVEACPYDVLFMGYRYELSKYQRRDLVTANEQLLPDGKKTSGYFHPEIAETLPEQTLLINRDNGVTK